MIAFEELAAALERWRIRNGLPVVSGDLPVAAAPASMSFAPPDLPLAARVAYTAPVVAPAQPVREDSDVLAIEDADVAEDADLYDNEGDDFAMKFDAAPPAPPAPPPGALDDDEAHYASGYDDQSTYVATEAQIDSEDDLPAYEDDPAYDPPPVAAAPAPAPAPADEEMIEDEEEDWGKLMARAGQASDPIDAGDEVLDEQTVIGDHDRDR